MSLVDLLNRFRAAKPHHADRESRRFVPRLEALEERRVPALLTVTNANDSGPGSLRQAILDSNGSPHGNTIHFAIGSGVQTIKVGAGGLPISDGPWVIIDATTQPGFSGTPLIVLDGSSAGPGGVDGLRIWGESCVVRGLVIHSFSGDGIEVMQGKQNVIAGNYIGTDPTGTLDWGNRGNGVLLNSGQNTVGGTVPDDRNIISGNEAAGVQIKGAYNSVYGNHIGTDVSGSDPVGNANGILIQGVGNRIGKSGGGGNVISGNKWNGIEIVGSHSNRVMENHIGTDASGTDGVGNLNGIFINNSSENEIGDRFSGNVIAGNHDNGVMISGQNATNNKVRNNTIGLSANGAQTGNGGHGVYIRDLAGNNRIGDDFNDPSGGGNQIAFNGADGVYVESGLGNRILFNTIFLNRDLGIDLGPNGVTPNDGPGDMDNGANGLQNAPTMTLSFNNQRVAWSLESTPNTTFVLQFFHSGSNGAPGQFLLKTLMEVRTNAAGRVQGTFMAPLVVGEFITATATGPLGTSEFSLPVQVDMFS